MEKYNTLFKWMIIPLAFMQFGIFSSYWGDFSQNAWSVHIHYWTGTVWYLYLIIQPYLATHGHLEKHRTNGIIGMFLAGAVCFTAFSMMHRDVATAHKAMEEAERFGPFKPWFAFGVASIEIPMILAFGFAVIKSIIHRKSMEDHAWWLISTVFIIMMPALGRGIQGVYIGMNSADWPNIDIMFPLYISQCIIIALTLIAAWKYKKLTHPATFLAVGVNLYAFFLQPIGKSESVQAFLEAVIKG